MMLRRTNTEVQKNKDDITMIEITNKIFYVGVNDRNKSLFEGLWPLPNGVPTTLT